MKIFKSSDGILIDAGPAPALDLAAVKRVLRAFTIGSRIRYYLEFEERSRLESLVVGYVINHHWVFSRNELLLHEASSDGLCLQVGGKTEGINRIDNFCLLLPSDSTDERKLDYPTRASLGRRGPFAAGKQLVLMSLNPQSENLKLEANVKRNLVLNEGIHSGHRVALLDVDLERMESYEMRSRHRVPINIPATVESNGPDTSIPIYILDIADSTLRFVPDPPDKHYSALKINSQVNLVVNLENAQRATTLRCRVMQRRDHEVIVDVEQIFRRGQYDAFDYLDAMELKIALHGMSQRRVDDQEYS